MSRHDQDRRRGRPEDERGHVRGSMSSSHRWAVPQHHGEDRPPKFEPEEKRERILGVIAQVDNKIPRSESRSLSTPAEYPEDIQVPEPDEDGIDADGPMSVSSETIRPPEISRGTIPPWGIPGLSGYERRTPPVQPPGSAHTDYTTCVAIHRDVWTAYECAYISKTAPKLQHETSKSTGPARQLQSKSSSPRGVIPDLKTRLENAKVDSVHEDHRRAFIPCVKLYNIMNENAVRQALEELVRLEKVLLDQKEIEGHVCTIAPPMKDLSLVDGDLPQFRRVFAVLILIGKEERIFNFICHKVNDVEMCDRKATFELPTTDDEEELQMAYDRFPGPCRDMKIWSKQDIRNFQATRWEVSPPFFFAQEPREGLSAHRDHALIHYELRSSDEILPFLKEKRKPVTNGGFSQLEFYRLHEDQHDLKRYTIRKKKNPIAVKRLEDKRDPDHPRPLTERFTNERYVLQRLTLGLESEHLVKLLATYETLGDNCPNKYHFIFEAADGTVATLWKNKALWEDKALWRRTDRTPPLLPQWAARQCRGLADALAQFHRFQKGKGDENPKTRGMHSDLKPDNILWYRDWDVGGNSANQALGILQIADFGLSSFHSTGTVFDVKIVTVNDYTAPETERWFCHPPASDVWALGCLFLDFATWLVGGPEEYAAFVKGRNTAGAIVEKRARFSEFVHDRKENLVDVVVSSKVVDHAGKLHRNRKASQFVRDLISLVLHDMFVVEEFEDVTRCPDENQNNTGGRITSSKVTKRLDKMEELSKDPTYYLPSKPKTEFRKPTRSAIRFNGTLEELNKEIRAIHGQVKAKMEA